MPHAEQQSTTGIVPQGQRLRMTYEEYLAWADEDLHAEWVDGEVIVQMPPKIQHQRVSAFLLQLIGVFAQMGHVGTVLGAPTEMRAMPNGAARAPDILFVAQDHLQRLTETRLSGPADLIVELVSDDSVSRDRSDKFYEYQAAGVPEYWILDPRPGSTRADFYVLDAQGRYQPVPIDANGRYYSTVLPSFWIEVAWVLAAEPPDVIQALAQIVGTQQLLTHITQRSNT